MSGPRLVVEKLTAGYVAGLPIVRDAGLTLADGEMLALIGPNGAGKSTLLKAILGLVPHVVGRVRLDGHDVAQMPAHEIVRRGLAFVPQTENVFTRLSVAENLELGGHTVKGSLTARLDRIYALFPDLARQRRLAAGRLSGGQRQMLAIGRALMVEPTVLALDEPSAGLSPKLVAEVFAALARLRDDGLAVLVVEQNVKAALAVADRAMVLADGTVRLEGPARALGSDPQVAALYLGHGAIREAV